MQIGLKIKHAGQGFRRFGQKGFTLVEVLVVIAILGSLAGVVIISVIQLMGRGACEAAVTERHNVQVAAIAYAYVSAPAKFTGTVDSTNKDVLAPYLLTYPQGSWTLTDGVITAGDYPGCPDL